MVATWCEVNQWNVTRWPTRWGVNQHCTAGTCTWVSITGLPAVTVTCCYTCAPLHYTVNIAPQCGWSVLRVCEPHVSFPHHCYYSMIDRRPVYLERRRHILLQSMMITGFLSRMNEYSTNFSADCVYFWYTDLSKVPTELWWCLEPL